MSRYTVRVLDESDGKKFAERIELLLNEGFVLQASSVGFVNSEQYQFCGSFQALLVKDGAK